MDRRPGNRRLVHVYVDEGTLRSDKSWEDSFRQSGGTTATYRSAEATTPKKTKLMETSGLISILPRRSNPPRKGQPLTRQSPCIASQRVYVDDTTRSSGQIVSDSSSITLERFSYPALDENKYTPVMPTALQIIPTHTLNKRRPLP